MSVMQYIAYNRVLYARQLLAQGMGAAEAAREVGFSDYSSFYRSYRKVTGALAARRLSGNGAIGAIAKCCRTNRYLQE